MNILTGYLSASEGVVKINGHDVLEEPNEAKSNIGYLPEQPPLYLDMTVREYLDFMYDLKKCDLPRAQHIAEICRLMKITDVYGRLIKNLSKGYRQRVGFAQALIGNPPVLILDEPTVGLDPNQIIEIRSLIKSLGKHHTVILSSHILPEIEAVCDRIVVINKGAIVANDTAENLSKQYSSDRRILLRVAGPEADVSALISRIDGVDNVAAMGEREPGVYEFAVEVREGADIRRDLFDRLANRKWPLMGLKSMECHLQAGVQDLLYLPHRLLCPGGAVRVFGLLFLRIQHVRGQRGPKRRVRRPVHHRAAAGAAGADHAPAQR